MTGPDRGKDRKTGDILMAGGLIGPGDVENVLAIQEKNRLAGNRNRLFGMVLCDLNLITPMDNYCALASTKKLLSLKDYLVKEGVVSPSGVGQLAARAGAEGVPFISFLLDQKAVGKSRLQQILFDLFYLPFRSVSDIVFDKQSQDQLTQVIGPLAAEKHLCIPLQLNGSALMVGLCDPSNLMFLRDLDATFPQYRFTPVFIPFSGFTWFFRLLYGKNWEGEKKSVDPRVLMKSSMVIQDPVADKEKIFAFFDRYEQVSGQAPAGTGRQSYFFEFIRLHHDRMAARTQCRRVRFSLKAQGKDLKIIATPEPEAQD